MRALSIRPHVFVATLTVIGLWAGLACAIDTRTANVGPPQRITANAQAMADPPANADAYADEKQDRIGEHHRPTIELVAPAGVQAAPPPEAFPQTTVVGDLVMAESNLEIKQEHALTDVETSDITSTVCEPSVAVRGNEVLVTGNWFSAFSINGGTTFTYINPDTTFPSTAGGFCCDQVALYAKSHDLMIWFLQYVTTSQGNVARVAVAQGADIRAQNWRYYDFSPQSVGNWTSEWFDYPELALGEKFLYVTTNTFSTSGGFTRAVVLRLPLDALASYQGFSYRFFDTNQIASIRPTLGATDTMYFGAHRNLNTIRVMTWPESSTAVSEADAPIQTWSSATRVAPGPDGRDWLGRADGRITAAAVVGNDVAFGWTAAQDETHPFPHVRVALINKNTKVVSSQPHMWNNNFAFAYPAFAPNSLGTLGVAMCYGGSSLFPSQGVGIFESGGWKLLSATGGTHGPSENKWGDYQAARAYAPDPRTWVAVGFSLQGGPARRDIQVKYVRFGDKAHVGGDITPPTDDRDAEIARLKAELESLRGKVRELRDAAQSLVDQIDAVLAE